MFRPLLILLSGLIVLSGCHTTSQQNGQADADAAWSLPKDDLQTLPQASHSSLIQLYDEHNLANRDVSFRDERLLTSNGTNSLFTMPVYKTKTEWEKRKQYLREHILVCAGLWPLPERNPLNPKYYHKIDHGNYIVETVTIETYPGFFLAGNIYRPAGKGPFPAVLSAHGHFPNGRLNNDSINSVSTRCLNFVKQGYVVFAYDMTGYNDTRQVAHIFARGDSISTLYGINLLGLQLRNSMRALDFLLSLPEVDSSRIAITGASGGGTQVYMLTAVDDRFQAAAPVNMVSDNMQGGDLCENAPGLRINPFNVEIASMIAPKPLLLVSDTHDWTYDTRNTILPMVKSIYHLYQSEDKLKNTHFDFIHNYNRASSEAVEEWFGKWLLHENDASKFREVAFQQDSDQNLLAFMNKRDTSTQKAFAQLPASEYHGLPNTLDEPGLKELLKGIYAKQLAQYWPKDANGLDSFKLIYGKAVRHLIGAESPEAIDCRVVKRSRGDYFIATQLLISRKDRNEWIPCLLYQPVSSTANSTVIVTGDRGKEQWVAQGSTVPNELIHQLINQKCNVLVPDLFKQGEHTLQDSTMTRRDENAKYFNTFNLTDRQEQVQDLLTLIRCIKESRDLSHSIKLYSTGNSGITGLLLSSVTSDLNKIVLDGDHFDPTTDQQALTLEIPGIMRVGGLKTVLALSSGQHLRLFNANKYLCGPEISKLAGFSGNTLFSVNPESISQDEMVQFLTKE
ncbi:MAG: prolyl oligopeptidase family serine peptidase [Bacteroidota bacterium]|nr:prolyl oligopeptidase family serine peptidase [Bacteroidota bacterium]